MSKEKRPTWFKMFLNQKYIFDSVPDETLGKALKAALEYFDTGEIIELSPLERTVFASIKHCIDESYKDFERTREQNRQNALKRWKSEEIQET